MEALNEYSPPHSPQRHQSRCRGRSERLPDIGLVEVALHPNLCAIVHLRPEHRTGTSRGGREWPDSDAGQRARSGTAVDCYSRRAALERCSAEDELDEAGDDFWKIQNTS